MTQSRSSGLFGTPKRLAVLRGAIASAYVLIFAILLWLQYRPIWPWPDWASLGLGAVLSPYMLLTAIYNAYLSGRALSWLSRQAAEKRNVAKLQIPSTIPRPETFDQVQLIDAAQKQILPDVPNAQGLFRARALTTYMAPPVAVLLAGLQVSLWPKGIFAAGLIAGQAVLLLWVVRRILTDRRPTQEWIERRTRGELLRREQYLSLARIGPYYGATPADANRRIDQIQVATFARMTELIAMRDEITGAPWSDSISHQSPREPIFPDFPQRLASYQYYRTGKQLAWLHTAGDQVERDGDALGRWVAMVTMLAIIASCLNAARFVWPNVVHLDALGALSGFLPALSGALLALQSIFNLRILNENYRYTELVLERQRAGLVRLEDEVDKQWGKATQHERRLLEVRFQRAVLDFEGALTEEYVRWRMITERDAYELV